MCGMREKSETPVPPSPSPMWDLHFGEESMTRVPYMAFVFTMMTEESRQPPAVHGDAGSLTEDGCYWISFPELPRKLPMLFLGKLNPALPICQENSPGGCLGRECQPGRSGMPGRFSGDYVLWRAALLTEGSCWWSKRKKKSHRNDVACGCNGGRIPTASSTKEAGWEDKLPKKIWEHPRTVPKCARKKGLCYVGGNKTSKQTK